MDKNSILEINNKESVSDVLHELTGSGRSQEELKGHEFVVF